MSVLGNAIATFAANALKIYNIVHGGPTETVATDGGNVPTFAKLLRDAQSDLSLQTPVAYTAGIVVDSTLETVVYNDVVYSAKESAIPFTTSNWATDEAKLRVATLSADDAARVKALAGSGGAAGVGAIQSGAGAVARTVESKLRERISVFDYMTAAQIADVRAGAATLDVTAALQAAFDEAGNWSTVAHARTLYLPGGVYKTTATLNVRPYVNIEGDGMGKTRIKPTMSSGAVLNSNAVLGGAEAFLQHFSGFCLDGTNCTGTAFAWDFDTNKNSVIRQVEISGFSGVSSFALSINGACYGLSFNDCRFHSNKQHVEVIANPAAPGDFSTCIYFTACLFDSTTSTNDSIHVKDCSDVQFIRCIFQSCAGFVTMRLEGTATAATGHDHIIKDCWFEDNGNSQVGSTAILCRGVAGKKMTGVLIEGNRFHQSTIDLPTNQIELFYCDKIYIEKNISGDIVGNKFLKDTGNNTNVFIERRGIANSDLSFPVEAFAWGRFTGTGSVSAINSHNVASITRVSAGVYEVTMTNAANSTNYCIVASAEDGGSSLVFLCSPGVPISTTVFRLYTGSVSGTSADARTVNFQVFATF